MYVSMYRPLQMVRKVRLFCRSDMVLESVFIYLTKIQLLFQCWPTGLDDSLQNLIRSFLYAICKPSFYGRKSHNPSFAQIIHFMF